MTTTTFVRIDIDKNIIEYHRIKELIIEKCFKSRLTYRTISGEYFSILEDELIYTSSNPKY